MTNHLKIFQKWLLRPLVAWSDYGSATSTVDKRSPVFGARLSRHDDHCLEIKAWVEPGHSDAEAELDVYVFVPGSFQISGWKKSDLVQDFRSRVRLALPSRTEEAEDSAGSTLDILARIEGLFSRGGFQADPEDYKQVGGLLSEVLKQRAAAHRRRFLMAHSLSLPIEQRALELGRLLEEVRQTSELLHGARRGIGQLASAAQPIVPLLDEYLSNFYVQYLGKLRATMQELDPGARERADGEAYRLAWANYDATLSALQRDEATYRQRFPRRLELAESAADQEQSVVRLSQLKKFFQSRMFVDVSRYSPSSRFLETTAIAGTALAGCLWALVQFLNSPELARTTNRGAFVWGFAVLAYVLRDRVKDRAKHSLHKRVQKWLPDSDQQLQAGGQTIGSIREWFQVRKRIHLGEDVQKLRWQGNPEGIDRDIPEDVLHVRKVIAVHSRSAGEPGWALQENTRVNIERYLKHMDDPIKELAVLNDTGELTKFRSRRVYHFHVAVDLRLLSASPHRDSAAERVTHFYRVVIDKEGIDRLERVS